MNSREKILTAIKQNQPDAVTLPDIAFLKGDETNAAERFISMLTTIGGKVFEVGSYEEIAQNIAAAYQPEQRIITLVPELAGITTDVFKASPAAHHLQNVELAVLKGHFGVAENGAVWITEDLMGHRALPFISQHLAIVINKADVVPTMHEAYQYIADADYGFGTFISGPSKTADIEQSLVLGAHGARSMTVFLIG